MKTIVNNIKKLEIEELDKLIFLFEQELYKKFNDATDGRLYTIIEIRDEIEDEINLLKGGT